MSRTRATSANAGQPLLDMCPRCLLCCCFLRFPAAVSCGLVTRAGILLCAACALCVTWRLCLVYGSGRRAGADRRTVLLSRLLFDIGLTSARRTPALRPGRRRAPGPAASAGLSCTPLPSAVGVCRDAARGRPMCDEDEGALTSKEEVFAKTYRTSKKGLFGNIKHVLFCVASFTRSPAGGPLPNPVPE